MGRSVRLGASLPPQAPFLFCPAPLSSHWACLQLTSSPLCSELAGRTMWMALPLGMTHIPVGTSPGSVTPHLCPEGPHGYVTGELCEGTRDAGEAGSLLHCPSLPTTCSSSEVIWHSPAPRRQLPPAASPGQRLGGAAEVWKMMQGNRDPRPQDPGAPAPQ